MQINIQPIEKRVPLEHNYVDLHSIFETIQGEGPFCGTPCVFVRLAGCNLQCPMCDTEYTQGRRRTHINDLVDTVRDMRRSGLVVITGGEPFRQDISQLIGLLLQCGYSVQVESNGTLSCNQTFFVPWSRELDTMRAGGRAYLVCSPKTPKVHQTVHDNACAFKYVLEDSAVHPKDGLPTIVLGNSVPTFVARPLGSFDGPVYVQPADAQDTLQNEYNLKAAMQSCMVYGYTLQIQIHKIIGLE